MESRHFKQLAVILTFAGSLVPAAFGHSTGAPPGYSGAPGENTCVACHLGILNSGTGTLSILFPDPNGYVGGQQYPIQIMLQDPTARRWGFELSNRKEASSNFAGNFSVPNGSTSVQFETQGALQYMTHTLSGTYAMQTTSASWTINWTAPPAGTGTVRFYAAGNAANDDGTDAGDKIYAINTAVSEQTASTPPTPPAITTGSSVLSQFVFGGGWYTAMYFTNQGSAQVSFPVNFYTDGASPMTVNGATSQTLTIPAGGTALIEAQNTGALSSGWATFTAPTGVTGYGVFRQSVAGQADQEAVVPFASSTGTSAQLTFDETSHTTAIAIWYNGPASGTVTLAASDQSGNPLGTTTVTMAPGTKQSFTVISQLPMISGQYGSLVVSTSSGSISVLGLRFGGSAFTSIPAAPAIN
jgi:hypothetical protein